MKLSSSLLTAILFSVSQKAYAFTSGALWMPGVLCSLDPQAGQLIFSVGKVSADIIANSDAIAPTIQSNGAQNPYTNAQGKGQNPMAIARSLATFHNNDMDINANNQVIGVTIAPAKGQLNPNNLLNNAIPFQPGQTYTLSLVSNAAQPIKNAQQNPPQQGTGTPLDGAFLFAIDTATGQAVGTFTDFGLATDQNGQTAPRMANFQACAQPLGLPPNANVAAIHSTLLFKDGDVQVADPQLAQLQTALGQVFGTQSVYVGLQWQAPANIQGNIRFLGLAVTDTGFGFHTTDWNVQTGQVTSQGLLNLNDALNVLAANGMGGGVNGNNGGAVGGVNGQAPANNMGNNGNPANIPAANNGAVVGGVNGQVPLNNNGAVVGGVNGQVPVMNNGAAVGGANGQVAGGQQQQQLPVNSNKAAAGINGNVPVNNMVGGAGAVNGNIPAANGQVLQQQQQNGAIVAVNNMVGAAGANNGNVPVVQQNGAVLAANGQPVPVNGQQQAVLVNGQVAANQLLTVPQCLNFVSNQLALLAQGANNNGNINAVNMNNMNAINGNMNAINTNMNAINNMMNKVNNMNAMTAINGNMNTIQNMMNGITNNMNNAGAMMTAATPTSAVAPTVAKNPTSAAAMTTAPAGTAKPATAVPTTKAGKKKAKNPTTAPQKRLR